MFETDKLHATWHLDRAPADLLAMVERAKVLGEGAFSVVLGVSEQRVLKITTCQASQALLPRLVNRPTPGLPMVFHDFGRIGQVEAKKYYKDIPLHAFLMERLVKENDLNEVRKDACPRGDVMRARNASDAKGAYSWLSQISWNKWDSYALSLNKDDNEEVHPLVREMNKTLRGTRFTPLINTVHRLSPRVMRGEWSFDLVAEAFDRNVMLSQWGEPILADPVYVEDQPFWKRPYVSDDDFTDPFWRPYGISQATMSQSASTRNSVDCTI